MVLPPNPDDEFAEDADLPPPVRRVRRLLRRIAVVALIGLLIAVMYGWTMRDQIARDFIAEQLASYNIPATYDVTEISTDRQVLTNIVVGDPAHPDLTIERAEVTLVYGLGVPGIGRVTVVKPRIYGTLQGGKVSFGSLDGFLYAETDQPPGLPEWDVKLVDGRGLIRSGYGPLGFKAEGEGQLNDGFSGIFAAIAPDLKGAGCTGSRATLYGKIVTAAGRLNFEGPARLASMACAGSGTAVRATNAAVALTLDKDFAGFDLQSSLRSGAFSAAGMGGTSVAGPVKLSFRDGKLDSLFDVRADALSGSAASVQTVGLDGAFRARENFQNLEFDARVTGDGITLGSGFDAALAQYLQSAQGTLAQPLLAKLGTAAGKQMRGAKFAAAVNGRKTGKVLSLVVPQGSLASISGEMLFAATRVQLAQSGNQPPRISGNFRIGGRDLPAIVGRMERSVSGNSIFRLRMAEYAAASSAIEIPELVVSQARNGALGFAGTITASGPLPGGFAKSLRLPVDGNWSSTAGLSLWRRCTPIGFASLAFANLELANQSVTLCPASGKPILRQDASGLQVAAGLASVKLGGSLAGTPITIDSGPVGFAYPGVATAQRLTISLGPPQEANSFAISDIQAKLGEGISGSFSGADIALYAVPLDLKESSGNWSYASGVLRIVDGAFTLLDRAETARFAPIAARDATLSLENNIILANALLRNPESSRELSEVSIRHDLGSSAGYADLDVAGVVFDKALQPDQLTPLALGVVANAEGIVRGRGRIDWTAGAVTSSGTFSSESLDFAAVFGPVKGASGTVEFTDLLSLTTAPGQSVRVASINPGIEAKDGVIGFTLRDGQYLGVTGGSWPFMGGTLTLKPVDLNFGVAERRRYTLEVQGLDAALFVENLELGNLAATGVFDGSLPIEFDEQGFGEIKGGLLLSRVPGGNVSYVGELTYKDLSVMANYAFTTLRSLDYQSMRIEMDGPLTGDIVTKIRFDGVRQGPGTKQNFITRQIADLPIRFNVNIRAPFYKLVTTLKSIYDPSTVRDPRELGLLVDDGRRFVPSGAVPTAAPLVPPKPKGTAANPAMTPAMSKAGNRPSDELPIQTLDSEDMP